jgi:hypothetical protein
MPEQLGSESTFNPGRYGGEYGHYNGQVFDSTLSSEVGDWSRYEPLQDSNASLVNTLRAGTVHGYTDNDAPLNRRPRPRLEKLATRTIQLLNLSDRITYSDVTASVRGGQLLEIYLRSHDRSATISFLHGTDAKAFYEHVRKHDLYIQNKRVRSL